MGMKFQNAEGDKGQLTVSLIGDGTSVAASLPLTLDPFTIAFNNNPTAVSGPGTVSFSGENYTVAYALSGNPLVLSITLTPVSGSPSAPAANSVSSFSIAFIYQG